MNGVGYAWGFFGQDDWKVTPSLTLNLGLRYELHPPLTDTGYNVGAFLPDYQGPTGPGALVVPNQQAIKMADPGLLGSVPNTPLLTARQAGIPEALRYTDKKDFGPRIGFAWRPFHNDKTVIRGGYGRFIESPLGFALVAGWATTTSYIPYYGNYFARRVTPAISFPAPFPNPIDQAQPGYVNFYYAFPIHYKDPSVQQWNFTVERELGFGTGLRFSYIGNHGSNLEVMQDLNQVHANTRVPVAGAAPSRIGPSSKALQTLRRATTTVSRRTRINGSATAFSSTPAMFLRATSPRLVAAIRPPWRPNPVPT